MPNFAARISDVAARMPARPAIEQLRADGRVETTTYGALESLAGRIAAWLTSRRAFAPATASPSSPTTTRDGLRPTWARLRIGAIAVPLDTAYKAPQIGTVLENCGARLLFTTPRYLDGARAGAALVQSGAPGLVAAPRRSARRA